MNTDLNNSNAPRAGLQSHPEQTSPGIEPSNPPTGAGLSHHDYRQSGLLRVPDAMADFILTDCDWHEDEANDVYAHAYRILKPHRYAVFLNTGQDDNCLLPFWLDAGFRVATSARWMIDDRDFFCTVLVKPGSPTDTVPLKLVTPELPSHWTDWAMPDDKHFYRDLVKHFIREFSGPGEVVLDPYQGDLITDTARQLRRQCVRF